MLSEASFPTFCETLASLLRNIALVTLSAAKRPGIPIARRDASLRSA